MVRTTACFITPGLAAAGMLFAGTSAQGDLKPSSVVSAVSEWHSNPGTAMDEAIGSVKRQILDRLRPRTAVTVEQKLHEAEGRDTKGGYFEQRYQSKTTVVASGKIRPPLQLMQMTLDSSRDGSRVEYRATVRVPFDEGEYWRNMEGEYRLLDSVMSAAQGQEVLERVRTVEGLGTDVEVLSDFVDLNPALKQKVSRLQHRILSEHAMTVSAMRIEWRPGQEPPKPCSDGPQRLGSLVLLHGSDTVTAAFSLSSSPGCPGISVQRNGAVSGLTSESWCRPLEEILLDVAVAGGPRGVARKLRIPIENGGAALVVRGVDETLPGVRERIRTMVLDKGISLSEEETSDGFRIVVNVGCSKLSSRGTRTVVKLTLDQTLLRGDRQIAGNSVSTRGYGDDYAQAAMDALGKLAASVGVFAD